MGGHGSGNRSRRGGSSKGSNSSSNSKKSGSAGSQAASQLEQLREKKREARLKMREEKNDMLVKFRAQAEAQKQQLARDKAVPAVKRSEERRAMQTKVLIMCNRSRFVAKALKDIRQEKAKAEAIMDLVHDGAKKINKAIQLVNQTVAKLETGYDADQSYLAKTVKIPKIWLKTRPR